MYMRKFPAELMHMRRLESVMMVSRAGMASQSSSTPQKKHSLMSETEKDSVTMTCIALAMF